MFKFGFDVEQGTDDGDELLSDLANLTVDDKDNVDQGNHTQITASRTFALDDLIEHLPSSIAYSFLSIPSTDIKLPRRELFDIRLQLLAQEEDDTGELDYADNPSDLIPSIYEGGLKTWECSLDLAVHLHSLDITPSKVLELGSGSSIPSLFVFHQHLSRQPDRRSSKLEIHLQDYNAPILHLVTLPNFILTWYFSPAADAFRTSLPQTTPEEVAEEADDQSLELTEELITRFKSSLVEYGVDLIFVSGPWSTFPPGNLVPKLPYDLILTSETIYNAASHLDLISTMKKCSTHATSKAKDAKGGSEETLILLSSKTIYFGLPPGGDIATFLKTLSSPGECRGEGSVVWSNDVQSGKGVGRQILRLSFS